MKRDTIAGYELKILDDKLNVCKGKKSAVMILKNKKIYKPDEESGKVYIPFGTTS
jgi:hypothetical protein